MSGNASDSPAQHPWITKKNLASYISERNIVLSVCVRKGSLPSPPFHKKHPLRRDAKNKFQHFLSLRRREKEQIFSVVAKGRTFPRTFEGWGGRVVRHKHNQNMLGGRAQSEGHNEIPCWRREKSIKNNKRRRREPAFCSLFFQPPVRWPFLNEIMLLKHTWMCKREKENSANEL